MQFLLSVSFLVAQSSAWSWTVSNASNFGPKVSGHACAVSEDPGRIMIFGGLTGSAGSPTTADLWEWKGGKEVWDRLPGKAEEGAARPGRRMYAASAVLGGSFYLFGGWDPGEPVSGGKFLDDIWRLSLDTNTWDRMECSLPFPVSRHCACAVGPDAIAIHTHKGLLLFSQDGGVWSVSEKVAAGKGPRGLSMCASTAVSGSDGPRGRDMLIFGGSTRTQELSSAAFVLDTQSWTWRKLVSEGGPGPIASSCASSLRGSNRCIVFGGATLGEEGYAGGLIPKNDTWLLTVNGASAEWEQIAAESESPEGRVAASLAAVGDDIVLQGGWDPLSKDTYGDKTWILKE